MIRNSISGVLDDVVKATANNMQLYAAIHEAVFSNQPSVKTQIYLENGEARDIEIPSLGYMKSRVDRLDSTIETLVGATGNSVVRMADGSYRKLYINRLDIPRATEFASTKVSKVTSDSIINLMEQNVNVEIPLKLYNNEDTVELNIVAYHGSSLSNLKSNLSYSELKQALDECKEAGTIDSYLNFKEIKHIEPADMTAYGSVYVLRVVDTESIDANENVEHKKIYYISSISFTGKEGSVFPISQGDVLTVYNTQGYHDTRVKVDIIDKTRGYIKVSYVDGYQPITVGTQLYPYVDNSRSSCTVKYPISNRYQYWIYPTLITQSGYRHEEGECVYVNGNDYSSINDLGKYIDKFRTDSYKTVDEWRDADVQDSEITPPDAANNTDDVSFTIVNVSDDISTTSYTKISQLEAQKQSTENTIESLRDRINVLHNIISSGTSVGSSAENELSQATQSLSDAQSEFNTLVFNISNELSSKALDSKYEIHGIIKLKSDIAVNGTTFQCIGVEVRYRFVGTDTDIQKKEYYDLNGTKVPFNAWKMVPFNCRSRSYNADTKKYRWDPNTTNQTSIVIPIESRYNTIIQYRYVIEAGYPENPQKSAWSDDIYVPWDSTLEKSSMKALQNINQADQVKSSVNNTLSTNGMFRHIENSFTAGETYFAHTANEIASGWVNDEQTPISLYEKLKSIMTIAQELEDSYNAVDINNFQFTLISSDGSTQDIKEGTNNTVTTPTYIEMLKNQNGKAVTSSTAADVDYVCTTHYTLRISAKSKYVRFTKMASIPGDETSYNFTTTTPHSSGDGLFDYDENTAQPSTSILTENRAQKISLLTNHIEFDKIKSSNNSIYVKPNSNYKNSFATIMREDAERLLFNEGSTLKFADETYLDIPITLVICPVTYDGNNTFEPTELMTTSTVYNSEFKICANVGSYINSLDLTIGITFKTSHK